MPAKRRPPDDPDQSKRFEETARAFGIKSGAPFKRALKAIAPKKKKR
jgi:hypothetical protein